MQRNRIQKRDTFHRHHRRWTEETADDVAAAVGLERDERIAKLLAIEERPHRHETRIAERRVHDEAAAVGADANVATEANRFLESGIGAPIELILAGDSLRFLRRLRRERNDARRRRIVVIEELRQEWTEAQLTAGHGVVGDEHAELLVRNQRQIGV